jgi:transposase
VYDALIDAIDLKELGIEIDPNRVGNSAYDPKSMLKLLVYGYSYGVRSSRILERETLYNVSFMWLTGKLTPDHKTISEFRRKNKEAIAKVLRQCVRMCLEFGLIEGNTLFVDGTKIRANASIKNTLSAEECRKIIKGTDERIEAILAECEAVDNSEKGQGSLVKLSEELSDENIRKEKIAELLDKMMISEKNVINSVDPECCAKSHSVQGTHAGYNVQSVVDEKNGLIVNTDVVGDNNDRHQFAEQINQAIDVLGKKCTTACADSGYANVDEMGKIREEDIKVIVPSQEQATREGLKRSDRNDFKYEENQDRFICKEGHILSYKYTHQERKGRIYRIEKAQKCRECRYFGKCTTDQRHGRSIERAANEDLRKEFERIYEQADSRAVYKKRQEKVEHPFGHMKRNLKMDGFLLRGLKGARAEIALLGTCFNVTRMITIMGGVTEVLRRLGG